MIVYFVVLQENIWAFKLLSHLAVISCQPVKSLSELLMFVLLIGEAFCKSFIEQSNRLCTFQAPSVPPAKVSSQVCCC